MKCSVAADINIRQMHAFTTMKNSVTKRIKTTSCIGITRGAVGARAP